MDYGNEPITRIVSLPFTSDAQHHVYALGLRSILVGKLSKVKSIRVIIAESVVPTIRLEEATPIEVGLLLNADFILVGRINALPEGFALYVQLLQVPNGEVFVHDNLWMGSNHKAYPLISFANQVTKSLSISLDPNERTLVSSHYTQSASAFECYVLGMGRVLTNVESDVRIAHRLFTRAVFIDDAFPEAWAYRGYALWRVYFSGWSAHFDTLQQALSCVSKAKSLNPESTSARLASIRICWDLGLHEQAIQEGYEILELYPQNIEAKLALSRALHNAGMADLSMRITENVLRIIPDNVIAQRLLIWNNVMIMNSEDAIDLSQSYFKNNPNDSNTRWAVTMAHLLLHQYDLAVQSAKLGIESNHMDFTLYQLLGYAYYYAGNTDLGKQAFRNGLNLYEPLSKPLTNLRVLAWLGINQAILGLTQEAVSTCDLITKLQPSNSYLLYRISGIYAELNMPNQCFNALNKAVDNGFLSEQIMTCEFKTIFRNVAESSEFMKIHKRIREQRDVKMAIYRKKIVSGIYDFWE